MTVQPVRFTVLRHATVRLVGLVSVGALDGDSVVWRNPITGGAEALTAGQWQAADR